MEKNGIHFEAYDDEKFESAFQAVLQIKKKDYPTYIGGMKIASGNTFVVKSPVDDSISFGLFQEPENGITDHAVDVAVKVHAQWSKTTPQERAAIFENALIMINAQRYRLAAVVLLSSGMTGKESLSEVDRLMEIITVECKKLTTNLKGKTGAWGIISAHNSPLASPMGHAIAAMLAGNTVVVMPSRYCPVPVYSVYEILEKVGLPSGVLNLIVDRKDSTYEQLANNARLEGVVVSGSADYLEDMMFLQVDDELKFLNETKGMNPIIIHRPGDLAGTVDDVLTSAFSYSGQRIFSSSKLILTSEDSSKFINLLIEKTKDLKMMDPAEKEAFSGPIISDTNTKFFVKKLDEVRGNIVCGGKKIESEFTQNGSYFTPAVITGLDDENELMYMDFGIPILCIKTVKDMEEAMEEVAVTECGLSAGIFSKDQRAIERFVSDVDVRYKFINESNSKLKPAVFAEVEEFLK